MDDPFYEEKGASKAKRNAIFEIIPRQVIISEYKRWKASKQSGKQPEPPSAEAIAKAIPRGKGKASDNAPPTTGNNPQVPKPEETSNLSAEVKKLVWLHKKDEGGERKMNDTDLVGYAKIFKDGKELCPLLHETIQSHESSFLLEGWIYTEDEEAGLYYKKKEVT